MGRRAQGALHARGPRLSELDAEFERLRQDARKKLDEEQALERQLAEYDRAPDPVAPLPEPPAPVAKTAPVKKSRDEAPAEKPSELLSAAKAVASLTPKKYRTVTLGKVIVGLLGLLFLGFLINKILMPLILFALVIAVIGWVVKKALSSDKEVAAADDEADDDA